jgi:hypothetical protein
LLYLPHERVLATTGTEDKDFHCRLHSK